MNRGLAKKKYLFQDPTRTGLHQLSESAPFFLSILVGIDVNDRFNNPATAPRDPNSVADINLQTLPLVDTLTSRARIQEYLSPPPMQNIPYSLFRTRNVLPHQLPRRL